MDGQPHTLWQDMAGIANLLTSAFVYTILFLRYNDIEIETSRQKSDRLPVSLKTRPILDLIPVGSGKDKMSTGLPRMELLCIRIQSDCFASSTNTRKVFVNDNGNCVSPTILLRDRKHVFWALPSQQTAACGQGSRR